MTLFNDVFAPPEEKAVNQDKPKVNKAVDMTAEIARACLKSEVFNHYRRQYVEAEKKVIDHMFLVTESYMNTNMSIDNYGAKMLVYMTRLRDLRSLNTQISKDARKGKKNENTD